MCLIEKNKRRFGREEAERRSPAENRRFEVETDEIVSRIRDRDGRRKIELLDRGILVALILVAGIFLLVTDQGQRPYLSSTFLAAAALVWTTRRKGPPDGE
jgi:hypothetical protein